MTTEEKKEYNHKYYINNKEKFQKHKPEESLWEKIKGMI